MTTKVIMPQLGESVVEGTVSRWLKQVGDPITEYEPLLEVSTDKVDTEIPAPATGILLQILVAEGQTVERGVLLALIGAPDEIAAHAEPETAAVHVSMPEAAQEVKAANRISPVVARMAAEHGIDLARLSGSGQGGRVTKKDVEDYLAGHNQSNGKAAAAPPVTESVPPWEQPIEGDLFKPTGEIFARANLTALPPPAPIRQGAPAPAASTATTENSELVTLSPMRRSIAEHMVRSKLHTSPHVTTVFEIDLSAVIAHQMANLAAFEKQGVRLTYTAYFVLAAVQGLQAQPWVNSQWTDKGALLHRDAHIGLAVAIPDGLIVPVIRNAGDLNLSGAARQVNDLAKRARAKQLRPDEVSGGTFTITNHGVSGSLFATPIINQPQAAILGIGALQKRVVVLSDERGDTLAIRPMLYATLTFDHRLIDGATGDGFMRVFKEALENWR